MTDTTRIALVVNITVVLLTIILTLIYLLPIILVRRFHTPTNILTVNFCSAGIICLLYWLVFFVLYGFYPTVLFESNNTICIFTQYSPLMVNCSLIYSLAMITINRFFTITYPNKRLFKTKTWPLVSLAAQWVVAIILPLPYLIFPFQGCSDPNQAPFWMQVYSLVIIVILPSILNVVFNSLIFVAVRSSTRRVHTLSATASAVSNSNHRHTRDVHLLKHIVFMCTVFTTGWAPVYILAVVDPAEHVPVWVSTLLRLLPVFSSLISMGDLYFYNHGLRQYLKEQCSRYLHLN